MIGEEDAPHTYEYDTYYKILPAINNWSSDQKRINKGKLVSSNFIILQILIKIGWKLKNYKNGYK